MNAVLIAVVLMLALSLARVHVVIALFIGAVAGGLLSGIGLEATMVAFQDGLAGGAKIALSYALLGAFAMAVAHSGLPQLLADWLVRKLDADDMSGAQKAMAWTKWGMLAGVLAMAIMSQNLIPVHIAFIPLLIPPLLIVMNRLRLDRRAVACVLTFGLITTYMYIPIGFGRIFLYDILYGNIIAAGLDVSDVPVMTAMGIPALGMVVGLLIAVFVSYRKPRDYNDATTAHASVVLRSRTGKNADAAGTLGGSASSGGDAGLGSRADGDPEEPAFASRPAGVESGVAPVNVYRIAIAVAAILACFVIQTIMSAGGSDADPLLVGALVGLVIFIVSGTIKWNEADDVFTGGMKMMALIGFIMIAAQGFAAVMRATDHIGPLVTQTAAMFGDSRGMAALAMLLVGLVVTMGIGSSFSTLPIIATIYVPLCVSLGFSPLATVAIVGTAGALGDAGSPASDSTLGPTAGLNADGQHDHIRDTVIPTFLHFNIPLLIAGWIAAMVL